MKRDTVMLYQPRIDFAPHYPCFWAPLSILTVAAPLLAEGFRVILLDDNLPEQQKNRRIVQENIERTVCLGISVMIGGRQLERALEFSAFVKSLKVNLPIIFGGPLATVITRQLLTSTLVDYAIIGQGEKPMSDLVECLNSNEIPVRIKGVISRNCENNSSLVFIDKNSFPPYPWHLLDVEKYLRSDSRLGNRVLNYASSQGCPHRCGYCSESAAYHCHWTALKAERLADEIIDLKKCFRLDGIKFYDANFFVKKERVYRFAELLSSQGLKWAASAHPTGIIQAAPILGEIKKSGLNRLLIGAESGSPQVLEYIRKGCTINDNYQVAELCAKHRIPTTFTFIVGFPGIDNDMDATLNMVSKIKSIWNEFEVKIHFYAPFPGAPLYEESIRYGYTPPDKLEDWSNYDYYFIQTPWVDKGEESRVRNFMHVINGH